MSNVPEAPRFGDEPDDLREVAPPPKRKSRIWLWVLGILGMGGVVLCCGCVSFVWYVFGDTTLDPAKVTARTTEQIIDFDPPEQFKPYIFSNVRLVNAQFAMYKSGEKDKPQSVLVLLQMPAQQGKSELEQRQELEEVMNQQLKTQGQQIEFKPEETTTKTYKIHDKDCEFIFAKGTTQNKGAKLQQVRGIFPSDKGIVMLMVFMPESDYDEEEIDTMIKSIK